MEGISHIDLGQFPLVALVGRVNVGKSALFNRLVEEKKAITSDVEGTTRDINYGICEWQGRQFVVADSGGFVPNPSDDIEERVYAQMMDLLTRADVIMFVVDIKQGLTLDDAAFLKIVKKTTTAPIVFVANKADKPREIDLVYEQEWYSLGLNEPFPVSAVSGRGVGDLLDIALGFIDAKEYRHDEYGDALKVAIVGKTNVGKSTLLNKLLGEERVIASPVEHTTREPQDMRIEYKGKNFVLVDTVGIRRKSRVKKGIERAGVIRSIKSIQKADLVVLVLDANEPPTKQELRLARLAVDAGAGLLLLVNKWDMIDGKDTNTAKRFEDYFKDYFVFVSWAPMMFVSALSGQRVHKLLDALLTIQAEREKVVDQYILDGFIAKAISKHKPIWVRGRRRPKIFKFSQQNVNPPTFTLLVNDRSAIQYEYLRYLENRLREHHGFEGTPVRVYTEKKPKKERHT